MPDPSKINVGDKLPTRRDKPDEQAIFFARAALWRSDDTSPALKIPAELTAEWMAQCALQWAGETSALLEFSHTSIHEPIAGDYFTTGGEVCSILSDAGQCTVKLFVRREDGETFHTAQARLQLD